MSSEAGAHHPGELGVLQVPGRQTEPSDGTQQDGCQRRAKSSLKPGTFRRLGNEGQLVAHGQQWPECDSRSLSVSGEE